VSKSGGRDTLCQPPGPQNVPSLIERHAYSFVLAPYDMAAPMRPIGCACRKLNPGILVMQSAQDWATKNVPDAVDGARDRCIFLQG
jgi:hypothetical protein